MAENAIVSILWSTLKVLRFCHLGYGSREAAGPTSFKAGYILMQGCALYFEENILVWEVA